MTDHALEQHVEEARRPPLVSEPRKMLGAERLARKLDELVPMEVVDRGGHRYFRLRDECRRCHVELILESGPKDESEGAEPTLTARSFAAGAITRRRHPFLCEACCSEAEAAEERAQSEEKHRERVTASNLDKAMQGFEFSQMLSNEGRGLTIAAARDWAVEEHPDPRGLCLFGDKGAGKTRLAATATWQRLRQWHVTWVSWPILLAQLGAAFNDSARAQAISVLTGKGALVLDDIAQEENERVSDWAKRQLFAAVDRRIQAGAPLLITTNLNPSAIGVVLGEKLMSRVVGYSRVLELPGQDMRLKFNFDGSKEKGQE